MDFIVLADHQRESNVHSLLRVIFYVYLYIILFIIMSTDEIFVVTLNGASTLTGKLGLFGNVVTVNF